MLNNRRVQLGGLAAAAGVGAYVLIHRKHTTGTTRSDVTSVAPATGGVATFDSTGTDVANWLGNYSGNLQNQLDAFSQTLHDSLQGAAQVPPQTTGMPRQQFYHPKIDPNTGEYKVESGAEPTWTNDLGHIAYAYGYTSPQALLEDPNNAGIAQKYFAGLLPGGKLQQGDVIYAKFNPTVDWKALFPNQYDPDPYGTAVRNGLAQKL